MYIGEWYTTLIDGKKVSYTLKSDTTPTDISDKITLIFHTNIDKHSIDCAYSWYIKLHRAVQFWDREPVNKIYNIIKNKPIELRKRYEYQHILTNLNIPQSKINGKTLLIEKSIERDIETIDRIAIFYLRMKSRQTNQSKDIANRILESIEYENISKKEIRCRIEDIQDLIPVYLFKTINEEPIVPDDNFFTHIASLEDNHTANIKSWEDF